MTILKRLFNLFKRQTPQNKLKRSPLLIIRKDAGDTNIKEYNSIEDAIADLENDPNVPTEKIEKLKASVKMLKDKTSIKIRNGELIK